MIAPAPTITFVNAGFNRRALRGTRLEHRNVQRIGIPLSSQLISTAQFRRMVSEAHPEGEGWMLTGYCLSDAPT